MESSGVGLHEFEHVTEVRPGVDQGIVVLTKYGLAADGALLVIGRSLVDRSVAARPQATPMDASGRNDRWRMLSA